MIRGIFTLIMILAFCLIIYGGPLALMITVCSPAQLSLTITLSILIYFVCFSMQTLLVQVKCFEEIISIGYQVYRIHGLPWFRSLSWYFLLTSNYFFYGENLVDYFGVVINRVEYLRILVKYHRFFSFTFYCIGFVWFVLSLVKKYYMKQFSLFAWTHVALLIVVTQSYLIIQNIFEGGFCRLLVLLLLRLDFQINEIMCLYNAGVIWFIVPVSMIVCNDVMAYVFGFFFGRTPLIKLSPKKTWEGFIGGGLSTVVFGIAFSYVLCQNQFFVCPIEYSEGAGRTACEPSYLFRPQEYSLSLVSLLD